MECGGGGRKAALAREVSIRIDKEIKGERKGNCRVKFLLWGLNDSGKSTFVRQLRIIYRTGLFQEEIERVIKPAIYDNIISSMKRILYFAEKHNLTPTTLQNPISAVHGSTILDAELADHIRKLWQDENIKKVWERRNEFNAMSNAEYYFNALDRIVQKDYIPTQDDMLNAKVKNNGVEDALFEAKGSKVQLIDATMNGTPRKWLHQFQYVEAIVFFVALDTYDMPLEDDPNSNQLVESLRLFSWVTQSWYLHQTPFAICFNKTDLFEEKLKRSPLNAVFPNYQGGDDVTKAKQFIFEKFQEEFGGTYLYELFTCAIDSNNSKQVFDALIQVFTARSLSVL